MANDPDPRESIMARLEEIAAGVVDPSRVYRNAVDIPEASGPAIAILEGEESQVESLSERASRRRAGGPLIMEARPQVYILEGKSKELVGPALNLLRGLAIRAILTDSELLAIARDGLINYVGMTTGLALGRTMRAEAGLTFAIQYVLRPEQIQT
jgi:hypothetical protein